jgi:PPM family protein phosphatase
VTGASFSAHPATDPGRVREQNEDSLFAGSTVFAVADGMGGHAAGEVASATALEPIEALDGRHFSSATEAQTALVEAIAAANDTVVRKAIDTPELRGMGTTLTAVLLRAGRLHLAHVGDSRAYLVRGGEISQLTTDHTLVEQLIREGRLSRDQAATHPQRSVITRAIGVDRQVEVDSLPPLELHPGDQILLCSDGLSGPVSDEAIAEILTDIEDGAAAAEALIKAANGAGGPDNITVVLLRVGAIDDRDETEVVTLPGSDGATGPLPTDAITEQLRPSPGPAVPAPGRTTSIRTRPEPGEQDWASQFGRLGDRGGADDAGGKMSYRRSRRLLAAALAVVVLLGVLTGGGYLVLSRAYFVGDDDGLVAIFNGLPNDVAGIPLYWSVESTDLAVDTLPEFRQERVREGIPVDSLHQARQTVEGLRATAADPDEDEGAATPATTPPAPTTTAPTAPTTPPAPTPATP